METSEEANQLWASALEKDLAPGIVDGRIIGTVKNFGLRGGRFGFIRAADGTEYHAAYCEIASDELNRTFLIPGETVSFRVEDRRINVWDELSAVAVIPSRVDLSRSAPSAYREEMVVISYDPIKGEGQLRNALDPLAKWVWFSRDEVLTEGSIKIGSRLWAGLRRRFTSASGFHAHSIEVIKEEKTGLFGNKSGESNYERRRTITKKD